MLEEIQQYEIKLDNYNKLIQNKKRLNRQNYEMLVTKTEDADNLRERIQYVDQLCEAEEAEQKSLIKNCNDI